MISLIPYCCRRHTTQPSATISQPAVVNPLPLPMSSSLPTTSPDLRGRVSSSSILPEMTLSSIPVAEAKTSSAVSTSSSSCTVASEPIEFLIDNTELYINYAPFELPLTITSKKQLLDYFYEKTEFSREEYTFSIGSRVMAQVPIERLPAKQIFNMLIDRKGLSLLSRPRKNKDSLVFENEFFKLGAVVRHTY